MAVLEGERRLISLSRQNGIEEPEPCTSECFEAFAAEYPDLRMELTSEGELIIMPPTMTKTGLRNAKLSARLENWSDTADLGESFDSSTIFLFPNGAKRSPDASWVEKSRWEALTKDEQEGFAPICPDFVAELRSKSDRLSTLQKKMREYVKCGAKLGWLIDPVSQRVEIYRPGHEVEILDSPTSLSGEVVLPGFTLNLKGILD